MSRIDTQWGRLDGIVRESEAGRWDSLMPTLFASSHASFLLASQNHSTLFCAWFSGQREGADRCAIVVARLDAAKQRWGVPVVASVEDGRSNQNPVLFEVRGSQRLFLLHTSQAAGLAGVSQATSELRLLFSDDGAQTWSEPRVVVAQGHGAFVRAPIVHIADELVLPLYFTPAGEFDHAAQFSATIRSRDAGQTWSLSEASRIPGTEGAAGVQPAVVAFPAVGDTAARLVAFMRNRQGRGARILRSQSFDGGRTWSAAKATAMASNNSSVAAAVTERAGAPVLLLAFNNCATGRFPLTIAASHDGGATFVRARDIAGRDLIGGGNRFATSSCCTEQRRGEHSYPSLAIDPREPAIVHVSWTHLRKTIAYARVSLDWLFDPVAAVTTGEWQPHPQPLPRVVAPVAVAAPAPVRKTAPRSKAKSVALADRDEFPPLGGSSRK